ncbi:MAG: hypothetical protein ISS66_10865 [Desulfobacteraceae bacterium]|nr:hypothetical protein [Desulfobacteraceae bacterium]
MQTCDRDVIQDYVEMAAKAVAASARSAPHTTGSLDLVVNILNQEEIVAIQKAVAESFGRDPERIIVYDGMLTIGAILTRSDTNWDCGACGFSTCAKLNKAARAEKKKNPSGPRPSGPSCNWKVIDWNISLDYAAAMASQLGLQTRVQDIQGAVALAHGFAGDVDACTTVPLMAEKRNPFFGGRTDMATKEELKIRRAQTENAFRRLFPTTMDLDMMDSILSGFGMRLSPHLAGLIEPDPQAAPKPKTKKKKK